MELGRLVAAWSCIPPGCWAGMSKRGQLSRMSCSQSPMRPGICLRTCMTSAPASPEANAQDRRHRRPLCRPLKQPSLPVSAPRCCRPDRGRRPGPPPATATGDPRAGGWPTARSCWSASSSHHVCGRMVTFTGGSFSASHAAKEARRHPKHGLRAFFFPEDNIANCTFTTTTRNSYVMINRNLIYCSASDYRVEELGHGKPRLWLDTVHKAGCERARQGWEAVPARRRAPSGSGCGCSPCVCAARAVCLRGGPPRRQGRKRTSASTDARGPFYGVASLRMPGRPCSSARSKWGWRCSSRSGPNCGFQGRARGKAWKICSSSSIPCWVGLVALPLACWILALPRQSSAAKC